MFEQQRSEIKKILDGVFGSEIPKNKLNELRWFLQNVHEDINEVQYTLFKTGVDLGLDRKDGWTESSMDC